MILVVGATGLVGGIVTRRLLEQEADVRILVRARSGAPGPGRKRRAWSVGSQPASSPRLGGSRQRMMAALEMFESPIEMGETARTFDVRLTPVEEYVRLETTRASV